MVTALAIAGLLALLIAGPASACVPEQEPPDANALVRHAVVIVVGRAEEPPSGLPIQTLDVDETLLGPHQTRVDLTKIADDDCPLWAIAPGPSSLSLWVLTDVNSIDVGNAGVWKIESGGRILDGWPPGDRPFGAATIAELKRSLASPATTTASVVTTVPEPVTPAVWLAAAGVGLVLLRRRLSGSSHVGSWVLDDPVARPEGFEPPTV